MKTISFIKYCILLGCLYQSGYAQTIGFSYDAGGNVTQRSLQVIGGGRLGNLTKSDSIIEPSQNFKVFPNPASTVLNIEGDLPENIHSADITLLTVNGQILKRDVYAGKSKTLDVSELKNGIYILDINYSRQKRSTYKIIVTK